MLLILTGEYKFVGMAKEQCEILDGMYKKMTSLFQATAKYFAFDPKKYTMEEYFTDVKTFIDSFSVRAHYLMLLSSYLEGDHFCCAT